MLIIKTFEIKNKLGLHARAAAKIVNTSSQYEAKISFERDGVEVNGKSILGLLGLACPKGSFISLRAEGHDAAAAVEALQELVDNKFGED
jgi:phosphocarrier protein